MRLSNEHRYIIRAMEDDGYVWLSHMSPNAQMRFRNKTRVGFTGYVKIAGLTFLTGRVAMSIERGCKHKGEERLPYGKQIKALEQDLIELESIIYDLRGTGVQREIARFRKYEN